MGAKIQCHLLLTYKLSTLLFTYRHHNMLAHAYTIKFHLGY